MSQQIQVSSCRTPIGSYMGKLSNLDAIELGSIAIKGINAIISYLYLGALNKLGTSVLNSEEVDELWIGNVCSANLGQNPAKQISIKSGLPDKTICTTVVIVGGTESMSQVPHYIPKSRKGLPYGHSQLIDGLLHDGLTNPYDNKAMGLVAEDTAKEYHICREDQDKFALDSYNKAIEATNHDHFKEEIAPVEVWDYKSKANIKFDETKFRKMKLAFIDNGTITAGNASSLNDGASALILVSQTKYESIKESLKCTPIFKIRGLADSEQQPDKFATSPSLSIPIALQRSGLKMEDVDYFEINEAFSVVAMVNKQLLSLSVDKLNVWGGGVALGHPLGSSGSRIVVTLCSILKYYGKSIGCAAVCNGGGGASAIVIERLN